MTMTQPRLDAAAADRAAGVLLAQACGDALGAPYEFGLAMAADVPVGMIGGGPFGWAPGEWTDDTSMSIPLLDAAERARLEGGDLLDYLDDVAVSWHSWAKTANDVGNQTRAVLSAAASAGAVTAASVAQAARAHHERIGRSAGNGSLMRTAPLALAYLGDADRLALAARTVSDLTHADPDAGDACVLWCLAIRHAVLTGVMDVRVGLAWLPVERCELWEARLAEAETHAPVHFGRNGWVVHSLQAAWSAISHTPVPPDEPARDSHPAQHLQLALETAVRAGGDTDTVAAIAGALLGARWGASAVPSMWRRAVHGWPGLRGRNLADRGLVIARGDTDPSGWPLVDWIDNSAYGARGRLVPHPHDPGVLLGDAAVFDDLPEGIDAIVSLCRVGRVTPAQVAAENHVTVWLIDVADPSANPNLGFVLSDAADAVAAMRSEGRTVLLHCVAAQSRTPTVAAVYAVMHLGVEVEVALGQVCAALPDASPNPGFRGHIARLSETSA